MTALRGIMKRRRVTTAALASAVGISPQTLRNIACGSAPSRRTRQAISNVLGVEVWPGVLPKERQLNFECGDQTEFATIEEAKRMAREFRWSVKRRGKTVTFIRSASFVIRYDAAAGGAHGASSSRKVSELIRGNPTPTATKLTNDMSPTFPVRNPRSLALLHLTMDATDEEFRAAWQKKFPDQGIRTNAPGSFGSPGTTTIPAGAPLTGDAQKKRAAQQKFMDEVTRLQGEGNGYFDSWAIACATEPGKSLYEIWAREAGPALEPTRPLRRGRNER